MNAARHAQQLGDQLLAVVTGLLAGKSVRVWCLPNHARTFRRRLRARLHSLRRPELARKCQTRSYEQCSNPIPPSP